MNTSPNCVSRRSQIVDTTSVLLRIISLALFSGFFLLCTACVATPTGHPTHPSPTAYSTLPDLPPSVTPDQPSIVSEVPPSGTAGPVVQPPAGDSEQPYTGTEPDIQPPFVQQALAQLDALPVKGRAPTTGYLREEYGQAWSDDVTVDFGHNGCDTRNDILRRDLTNIVVKPSTRECVILTGELADPYSGKTIHFQRGPHSADVQIDHVVALANAWQTGAQELSPEERRNFANDPRNLLAVSGQQNQQKKAADAATWLPRNKAYRCEYVAKQISVKALYGLWVTPPEKEAMVRILGTCS